MAHLPLLLLLIIFIIKLKFNIVLASSDMEEDELSGLFEVMGSLLDDPSWPQMHPQPCSNTPWPGLQCELISHHHHQHHVHHHDVHDIHDDDYDYFFHVTKIHIGPDIITPPCKPNATLSSTSFLKLPYLKTLSLFNCFTLSPFSLSASLFQHNSFPSLQHLSLVSNPSLFGSIPSTLGQIQTLKILSLSQNNFTMQIPKDIYALVNLQQLDLSYNNFTGLIPKEIGSLKSLTIMDLSHNNLNGQLPSSFGQLQNLQKFDLGFNGLSQRVPQEFGNLSKLVLLDLSYNSINGPLPESLEGLKMLEYLVFDHNPINTGLPLFIGALKNLKVLSFSRCGLIGPMMTLASLSYLKNLSALSLNSNGLNGSVPSNLGSLPNLHQLNLSQNQLSGELFVTQEFMRKIGTRLDIKGNNGLCLKNISSSNLLKSPSCFGKSSGSGNKSSWGEEEHQEELCEKMKPNFDQSNGCPRNHLLHGLDHMSVILTLLVSKFCF